MKAFLLVICLLAMTTLTSARSDQLTLAANFWEPFTGESLPHKGVAAQLVQEALARRNHHSEVIIMPWARLLRELESGAVDGVVAIWDTAQRRKFTWFSKPYYANQLCLVKQHSDDFEYHGLDSLHSRLVGVGRNYDYSSTLMAADIFSRSEAVTLGQNLARLARGRVDLVLSDCVIARYYLDNLHGKVRDQLVLMNAVVESSPLYFGMSKKYEGGEALIEDFNQGLAELQADGRYAEVYREWNIEPPQLSEFH